MYEQLELMTCPTQTSGASASHARTSASQASKKACKKVSEADCFTKLCDCLPAVGKKIDPDGYSLKMLKIYLALETDLTSRGCCLKWGGYGYSLQWDTLNSKDYGVPQNRERVFIVCYLGNISGREVFPIRPTDGENTCELKEITQGVADGQRIYDGSGLARTLRAESGGLGGKTGLYVVKVLKPYGSTGGVCGLKIAENKTGIASTCAARDYKGISRHACNAVVCMSIRGQKLQKQIDVTPTIDTGCRDNLTRKQTCCAVLTPDREEKRQNGRRIKEPGEPSFTLTAQDRHGVAIFDKVCSVAYDEQNKNIRQDGTVGTLTCDGSSPKHNNRIIEYDGNIRIRRLTPRECWRLQGFPDEYFDKVKAAGISDTQLYKQAGNGVTVNVARAIGERLKEVEEHDE